MLSAIELIENARSSTVLVLGASSLDSELLPALYETLCGIGPVDRLDVVLHCRGGGVSAARRVALLLREYTQHLTFIVPHYCESSATIMTLAAREIIAGPVATFSTADPILLASPASANSESTVISSQDVRLLGRMSEDWFGLNTSEARAQALSVLCASIFPTTLTALYRSALEARAVCLELLSLGQPDWNQGARDRVADMLLQGHYSRDYPLTRMDLKDMGLPVQTVVETDEASWALSRELGSLLGGGAAPRSDHDRIDAIVATRVATRLRKQGQAAPGSRWETVETR